MGVRVRKKVPGSGVWWIFINHHGRQKSKQVGKDRRTAMGVAKKIEAKLTLGDMKVEKQPENKIPLFKEYASMC